MDRIRSQKNLNIENTRYFKTLNNIWNKWNETIAIKIVHINKLNILTYMFMWYLLFMLKMFLGVILGSGFHTRMPS